MNLSNRRQLHDEDIMQWGKYVGERLIDVPDSYWRWFLSQHWCDEYPELVEYANVVMEDE
jgi:uncharacterized protein (DUF3820 family)